MSTEQLTNVAQKIAETTLYDNWDLEDGIGKKDIIFRSYQVQPNSHFKEGNNLLIEVYPVSGNAIPKSIAITNMLDLYKIDFWYKVALADNEGRTRAEVHRFKVLDKIMRLIHNNQTNITGIKIATLTRWMQSDELAGSPIVLHNSIFITAFWFHTKE